MSGYIDYLITSLHDNSSFVYIIRLKQMVNRNKGWYLLDVEEDPLRVMWSPYISGAFKFPNEEAVEDFKEIFLSQRPTEIIRIEKKFLGGMQ